MKLIALSKETIEKNGRFRPFHNEVERKVNSEAVSERTNFWEVFRMRQVTFLQRVVLITILAGLVVPSLAQQAQDPAVGDWLLKSDVEGRPMNSLLLITKDSAGVYTGLWSGFFGINKVDNLKIEGGKISFSQTNRFREQEMTSSFTGTFKEGKLEGTLSNDNGDIAFKGARMEMPSVIGVWEFRRQRQDQEVVSKLTVSRDTNGIITASWQSEGEQGGSWEISNVKYENEKLTFIRKNTNPERPMEMTYSLAAQGDILAGTATSQRGERQVEGKRLNSELIGKWELTLTSDRGDRKQLLYVLPDMTAMYGSMNAGSVTYQQGKVSFKYEITFGDRTFSNEFKGQLENGQLTGEMSSDRGTQQVKGKKMTAVQ
jgi:hypothetical protein